MSRSSERLQVARAAPLLRLVLVVLLMMAVLAAVRIASGAHLGWLALSLVFVASPVAVLLDGRSRARQRERRRLSKAS